MSQTTSQYDARLGAWRRQCGPKENVSEFIDLAFRAGWDAHTELGLEQQLVEKQKGNVLCEACDDTGWVPEPVCKKCKGRGWFLETTHGAVRICGIESSCRVAATCTSGSDVIRMLNNLEPGFDEKGGE